MAATEQKILNPAVSRVRVAFTVKVVKKASRVRALAVIGPDEKASLFTVTAPSDPSP
jgi:hypothetical protein